MTSMYIHTIAIMSSLFNSIMYLCTQYDCSDLTTLQTDAQRTVQPFDNLTRYFDKTQTRTKSYNPRHGKYKLFAAFQRGDNGHPPLEEVRVRVASGFIARRQIKQCQQHKNWHNSQPKSDSTFSTLPATFPRPPEL